MRYRTAADFRISLEQRLKNEAETTGIALMRLRKRVAFERLLARLVALESEGWVLKGAYALELRLGLRTRMTKDIDLARPDDEEATTDWLNAASALDLQDFFVFEVRRRPVFDEITDFRAVRYSVKASLDGRPFEQFPVDVGLGEPTWKRVDRLPPSNLLEFAGIAAPHLPLFPLEHHVAEKLHAYTGTYGVDGRASTRVKDLVDLVLVAELTELEAAALRQALGDAFQRRGRESLPEALPPPPDSWAQPYAQLAREVGLSPELTAGHAVGGRFLDPILDLRAHADSRWDPAVKQWRVG